MNANEFAAVSSPLTLGLAGCGDLAGTTHATLFAEAGFILRAAYDPTRGEAESLVTRIGNNDTIVCSSFDELLAIEDLAVVTIASPPSHHCDQVCAALARGKHVLCEQPSTLSSTENRRIVAAQEASGKHVTFFTSRLRYAPIAKAAKRILDERGLGTVYRTEIRSFRRTLRPEIDVPGHANGFSDRPGCRGGAIFDTGRYLLDLSLDLLDWPKIQTLSAARFRGFPSTQSAGRVNGVEEHTNIFIRTESGMAITLDIAATRIGQPEHTVLLLGTTGALKFVYAENQLRVSLLSEPSRRIGKIEEQVIAHGEPECATDDIYRAFADAIRLGCPSPGTTPQQALMLTELCERADESAALGREVSLAHVQNTPSRS